jgi:CRP-like cAMP-binding protein
MNSVRERFYFKCDNIFEGVDKKKLALLDRNAKNISIKKNTILIKEGVFPDGVYFLKKGKIKIYQLTPSGKFQILYVYTENEYFGFRPILSHSKNPISTESIEDCELIFYPKASFLNLLDLSPILMKNLLFSLSYEFNIWINRMTAFAHKAVKERVALALLILNEKYKKNEGDNNVSINFGREDLASLSGTTTETCVRILTQFKDNKIIGSSGRKIKILKVKELLEIANIF